MGQFKTAAKTPRIRAPKPPTGRIDGRAARTERTRRAVVDALLDLLNEGDLQPTAARIAGRAGVSLRLVFHHFDDLETIYNELADRQAERLAPLLEPVSHQLPFDRRVGEFAARRSRLMETIAPVRRAALLMEPFQPALAKRLQSARAQMRAAALYAFRPELGTLGADERRETAAALNAVASWSAWEQMRRHQGLNESEARKAMARTIRALLVKRH